MKNLLFLLFVVLYSGVSGQLRMSALFGDHMILQREKPVKIWGEAKPGETVHVTIGKITGSSVADQKGKWMVTLPPFKSGAASYDLAIKTSRESKIFKDILFGEVWLCSGQSNMQFMVRQAVNAKYEIHRANNPLIRQIRIPNKLSFQPEAFVDSTQWILSTPETTGDFTAAGFFFARDIFEKLHVPIGLIYDNWGGSQVESWISKEVMTGNKELSGYASQMSGSWEQTNARIEKKLKDSLLKNNQGKMPDIKEENIVREDYSFAGWLPASAPGNLTWSSLPAYRGEAYLMREVEVDSIQSALASVLSLGNNDTRFTIYLNGKKLPVPADKNLAIALPAHAWLTGKNILLVKIGAENASGSTEMGIHGASDQVYVDFDGEKISLADSKWKVVPVLTNPHLITPWMNNEGAIIYNAMLHPIIPFSIRGVLWYQGEANTGRAAQYSKTFPLMIESWRKEWNDDFYFYFVQLASFGTNESSNAGNKWPELRESQSLTLKLPKTGMAVTTDIGDANDIHPKNKQDVGHRLSAMALNDVYGFPQICSGPVYQSVSFSQGKALISFSSVGGGLNVKNKNGDLIGFEIAGADKKFYYAHAVVRGNQVEVFADEVKDPVAVRYGWSDAPVDINLYNKDGFPASPFRTDQWPRVTESAVFF